MSNTKGVFGRSATRIFMNAAMCALMCILSLSVLSASAQQKTGSAGKPIYRIIELEAWKDAETVAFAINDRGQVLGYGTVKDQTVGNHPFLWEDKKAKDISPGVDWGGLPVGINAKGQAVMALMSQKRNRGASFLWDGGRITELKADRAKNFFEVSGISNKGTIIGAYWDTTSKQPTHRACIWRYQGIKALSELPGSVFSETKAVNDLNQIVGNCFISSRGSGFYSAVLWDKSRLRKIKTLGGRGNFATAINNRGHVVGYSEVRIKSDISRAFLYQNGKVLDLGTLPGHYTSSASSINDKDQIVGSAGEVIGYDDSHVRAWLWQRSRLLDLNKLIPQGEGWVLLRGIGINNAGLIVGDGLHHGHRRAFLLIPTDDKVHEKQ